MRWTMFALAAVVALFAPVDLDAGVPDAYVAPTDHTQVYADASATAREIRELIERIRRQMEAK